MAQPKKTKDIAGYWFTVTQEPAKTCPAIDRAIDHFKRYSIDWERNKLFREMGESSTLSEDDYLDISLSIQKSMDAITENFRELAEEFRQNNQELRDYAHELEEGCEGADRTLTQKTEAFESEIYELQQMVNDNKRGE